ncbi:MAG: cobalt-factor II C(20)-methyltransferase [Methanomassiliicoccales archaeon]
MMLVAVGLGPGESDLLTLRAIDLLKRADKVFVPGKIAAQIVSPYAQPEILDFPMTEDEEELQEAMRRNADVIAPHAKEGLVVLGILGDPNFFSTYNHLYSALKERYPEVQCRAEPGISCITAFASRLNLAVDQGLEVSDGTEPTCLLLLKVRRPREAAAKLRQQGYKEFFLAERMYMPGEKIYRGEELPERSDYMSVLFARK